MTTLSCPVCSSAFREVLRDNILIDVCTQCRGVWLDRGELEKLLEAVRNASEYGTKSNPDRDNKNYNNRHDDDDRENYRNRNYNDRYDDDYEDTRHGYNDRKHHGHKKSKLMSILDIFD